jgi:hypothetical protein
MNGLAMRPSVHFHPKSASGLHSASAWAPLDWNIHRWLLNRVYSKNSRAVAPLANVESH